MTIAIDGFGLTVDRTSVTVRAQVRERIGIQTDCGHANIDYDDEGRWSGDVRVTFTTSDASASLSVPVTCEGGTPAGDDDDDVPATSPLRVSPRDLTIEAGFGDSGAASAPLTIENVSDGEVTFTVSVDSRLIVSDGAAIELPRGGRATTTLTSNCRLDGTHDVPVSVKIDAPAGHAPLLVQVTLVCDRGTPPPELTLHPERLDMVGHFGDGAAEPATYPRASLIVYNGTTDSMSADLVPSNEVRLSTSVLGLPLSAGERNTVTVTGMCPPRPPADAPSRVYRMTLDVRAPSGTIEVPVTLACWTRPADLPQRPAFRVAPDALGILPADTALPASEYFAVTNTRHDRRAIRVAVAAAGPYLRIAPTSVRLRFNETRHVRAEGACEVHGHFDHAVRVTATLDRDGAPEVHGANVQVALVCVAQDGAAVRGKPGSLRLVATRGPRKQDDNERAYYEVFDAVGVIAVHNAAGRPLPVDVAVDGGTADVLRATKSRNPDTGAIETVASEAQVPLLEVSHASFPPIHAGYEASLRVRSNCPSIRHEDDQTYKALLTLEPGGDAQGSTVEVFVVCPAIPRDAGTYGRITGPEPVALTATVLSLDGTSRHVAPYSLAGTASAPGALRIDVGTSPAMPSAPVPFTALSGGYLRLSSAGGTVPRGGRVSLRVETACPAGVAGEFYDAVELASSAEGVEGTFVQVLVKCAAVERDVLRVAPPGTLSVSGTPDAPSVITLTVYNKTVAPTARELSGVAVAVSGPGYLSATPAEIGALPSGNVLGADVVLETQCDAEAARATPYRHVVRLTPTAADGAATAPHDVPVNVTCTEDVADTLSLEVRADDGSTTPLTRTALAGTPGVPQLLLLRVFNTGTDAVRVTPSVSAGAKFAVSPGAAFTVGGNAYQRVRFNTTCAAGDSGVYPGQVTFQAAGAGGALTHAVDVTCAEDAADTLSLEVRADDGSTTPLTRTALAGTPGVPQLLLLRVSTPAPTPCASRRR